MPNWVYGNIAPSSDKGIKKLKEILEDSETICDAILPMPKELVGTSSPIQMKKITDFTPELQEFLKTKEIGLLPYDFNGVEYRKDWEGNIYGTRNYTREEADSNNLKLDEFQSKAFTKAELDGFIENYGASNWYDWANNNLGTKWGDCETKMDGDVVKFETAWAPFNDTFLVKLFNKIGDFSYDYQEEQGWGAEVEVNADGVNVLRDWDIDDENV